MKEKFNSRNGTGYGAHYRSLEHTKSDIFSDKDQDKHYEKHTPMLKHPKTSYNKKGKELALQSKMSPQGVRYLTKEESKKKTKNWPKSKGPMTAAEIMKMRGE